MTKLCGFMSRGRPLKRRGKVAEVQPRPFKHELGLERLNRRRKRNARLHREFVRLALRTAKLDK